MACTMAFSAVAQQVVHDDWQQLQIEFNTDAVHIDTVIADGQQWAMLSFNGSMPAGEVGNPMLPVYSMLVEVPLCKDFKMEVIEAEYETLDISLPILPMQPSRSKSDTTHRQLIVNEEVYSRFNTHGIGGDNAIEAVGIARDRRLARLQYSPIVYVPSTGKVKICRKATVKINYVNADREATLEMFNRHHSPAFASGIASINSLYPKSVRSTAPVRYLIVAHSQFRGQMDEFVQWKRRKGFITDIVYTDDPSVGTTTTAIQSYLQGQYDNATANSPAPTYVLLVGDVAQIPAFDGTTQNEHITDLYYTTWTSGDHLPDCYYGRFSAQNLTQLTPQIDKTLMYEQYTFADPSFLDRAVMVAGVDGGNAGDYGYTHADPAMDYAITNYINGAHGWSNVYYFKNNTDIVPSGTNVTIGSSASSNATTVRSRYNEGAGWINYSAHGGSTGWGTPSFNNSHVNSMTNTQKFGTMVGNCCQTNMYGEGTCFGEALLRKGNYCGAVGYIGGSDYTYWGEDFYWAVGVRSGIGPSMSMAYNSSHLGAYDRICHTHGEAYNQWATSQGSLMMMGNMAVESSTSGLKHYYWEIYHLMGDPSVMTWLTQANTMTITASTTLIYGSSTLVVNAVPHAYVALTDTATHTLQAAAFANASGQAILSLPSTMPVGGYEIAASAQQYRTAFLNINVVQPAGAFPLVSAISPSTLVAGDTVSLAVTIENIGNATANNIVAHLTTSNPAITLLTDSIVLDSLVAGNQTIRNIQAVVSSTATDGLTVSVSTSSNWTGASLQATSNHILTVNAPLLQVVTSPDILSMQPGENLTLTVSMTNLGHAPLPSGRLVLTPSTMLVTTSNNVTLPTLQPEATLNAQFTIQASPTLPSGISLPLYLALNGTLPIYSETLPLYVGQPWFETFEGGYTINGWTSSSHPWVINNGNVWQGAYSVRSAINLNHNESSELTLTVNLPVSDSVSFRYAVSSEGGYDKFHFYIDTTEMFNASGDIDWTRAIYPIAAGTHTLRFTYTKDYSVSNGSDCAWIDMLTLPHVSRPVSTNSTNLCQGQIVISGGDTIPTAQPGAFSIIHENGNSVSIEDYTVHPAAYFVDTVEACDSYIWHGIEYTSSYDTVSSYSSQYGCDSIVGLVLTLHQSSSETIMVEGCDSCVWNGVTYTTAANLSGSYSNIYGCDSSVTVKIRIYHPVSSTESVTTNDTAYYWNGETYTENGTYTMVLNTIHGCDSTVTLELTIDTSINGINDARQPDIKFYPNPTTGRIAFSCTVDECRIYDIDGRLIAEYENLQQLDLTTMPRGVYMLRVTTAEGSALLRVVLR